MKIVHVIFSLGVGGIENMLVDIVNYQVKLHDVQIIVINDVYDMKILKAFDSRISIFLLNRKAKSKGLKEIIRLNWLLLYGKYDIIHCHTHTISKILNRFLLNKTVLTVHDVGYEAKHFSKYIKLFAISNSVHNDLKKRYNLNSIVIYNGVNSQLIKIKKLSVKKDIFRIVCVGRLEHLKKGQDILIKSIVPLNNKYNIKVDIIGDGESFNYLMTLIKDLMLDETIEILGNRSRDYIYENLKNYDVLIQPSNFEGFGLTVVEGMLAKIPVIVSNIDGPIEIIDNGKYGYFFERGNVNSLSIVIEQLISSYNEKCTLQMIDEAYKYAKKSFDIENTAEKYLNNYDWIIKQKNRKKNH